MSPFAQRFRQLARSPQGARLFEEAAKLARDARSRERIDEARRTLTGEHAAVAAPEADGTRRRAGRSR